MTEGVQQKLCKSLSEEAKQMAKETLTVLGITSWSSVYKRQLLVRKSESDDRPINYDEMSRNYTDSAQKQTGLKQHLLDPNANVLLLVDDANLASFNECETAFRAKFESHLQSQKQIPVVVVFVEGGPSTVWSVKKALQHNLPCVFVNVSI
jgi:hypothetical protein